MDTFREGFGLLLPQEDREALWAEVSAQMEDHLNTVESLPVVPPSVDEFLSQFLKSLDFKKPQNPTTVVKKVSHLMSQGLLQTTHPAYYGVFNPAPSTMGIAADCLVAAFNPQLASTASAKVCIEMENHLIQYFGRKFGFRETRGSFTSGGTEANYTALLCALCERIPDWRTEGLGANRPVIYASKETHHSVLRSARLCGLGTSAVVELPVGPDLRLSEKTLKEQILKDQAQGKIPLLLVATLGSTSAGVFDNLDSLSKVAAQYGLWLHADAAWGGAAILLDECRGLFSGVEKADSLTLDAHKWLSVPMGAGIFLTRHTEILEKTFAVEASHYMPPGTHQAAQAEPYKQSMQWSRRFIGLKLLMTLAAHGETGYQETLRHQIKMGEYLRRKLREANWQVVNDTPLPVLCFVDPSNPELDVQAFARKVAATGRTWITTTKLHHTGKEVLRAGISNFTTQEGHIDTLIEVLNQVRSGR